MISHSSYRARLGRVALALPVVVAACASGDSAPSTAPASARSVVAQLSTRVVKGPRGAATPILGPSSAGGFRHDALGLSPVKESALAVRLPHAADGVTELAISSMGVRVELARAGGAAAEVVDGHVVYRGALDRGDVIVRVRPGGVEDHVSLPARPADGVVAYRVTPHGASGLRLVDHTLELLDAQGAPRLRMERPYVVGADDRRVWADVAVHGCAVDTSPRAPWGRAVTPPGAATCTVSVSVPHEIAYPAVLDPAWTVTQAMAVARYDHVLTHLANGKVLLAGGIGNVDYPLSAELFDPATKTWAMTGPATAEHGKTTGVLLNDGRVWVPGGEGMSGTLAKAELYDPSSGTFSPAKDVPAPRRETGLTLLKDGRVLLTGGCDGPADVSCQTISSTTAIYDPAGDGWALTKKMSTQRVGHVAALLPNGNVLVAGGIDATPDYLDTSETYDVASDTWSTPTGFGGARTNPGWARLADGKIVVVGGFNGDYMGSTVTYDPGVGSWVGGPSLMNPRGGLRVVAFANGVVAAFAGYNSNGFTDTSELLAPGASAWTGGPPLSLPRSLPGVAQLDGGSWLAAGGLVEGNTAVANTEIFAYLAAGQTCTSPSDCLSGSCTGGVCCDKACNGPCESCKAAEKGSGADGVCGSIMAGSDPKNACADSGSSCGTTGTCDGKGQCAVQPAGMSCSAASCSNGTLVQSTCDGQGVCGGATQTSCAPYACKDGTSCGTSCKVDTDCDGGLKCNAKGQCVGGKPTGSACTDGKTCDTGFCVDGVCCGTECNGQCETCDASGTCQMVKGAPKAGRPVCKGDGACAGTCDGVSGASCAYPGAVVSCGSSCAAGKETPSKCDGAGQCKMDAARDCAPYVCGATACKPSCQVSDDCASGYTCTSGACTPKTGATCSDDGLSVIAVDGAKKACGPFRCDKNAGACFVVCSSSVDCADGSACGADRICAAPKAPAAGDGGGCGCSLPGGDGGGGWTGMLLLAGVLIGVGRRRRSLSQGLRVEGLLAPPQHPRPGGAARPPLATPRAREGRGLALPGPSRRWALAS